MAHSDMRLVEMAVAMATRMAATGSWGLLVFSGWRRPRLVEGRRQFLCLYTIACERTAPVHVHHPGCAVAGWG